MIRRDMHLFRPWFARTPAARLPSGLPRRRNFTESSSTFCAPATTGLTPNGPRWDTSRAVVCEYPISNSSSWRPVSRAATLTRRSGRCTCGGQVRAAEMPPLLMLHASPGSARGVLPLAAQLAAEPRRRDHGHAGLRRLRPAAEPDPSIGDFADAVLEVVDSLGAPRVDLYGTHTGASIALETAVRDATRIRKVVFDGLPMFSSNERVDHLAHYIPPFEVRWDGSHVVWAWNFIRNMTMFYPWYHMDARALHRACARHAATARAGGGSHESRTELRQGLSGGVPLRPAPGVGAAFAQGRCCACHERMCWRITPKRCARQRPDVRVTWLPGADRLGATAAAMHEFLG